MQKHFETKSKLFLYTFAVTAVFYILAGGYRFFNTMYSGDSLLMIYQNDAAWQIAIGRFLQPFIVMFRGGMVSPFLISVLAMIWTGLSAFFLVDYLRIRHPFYVALTGAVMVCNITVVAGNATFLPTVDCFAMALFFAVLSVWLIRKERIPYLLLGGLSLFVSLGIYQAYLSVAVTLVMLHFLLKLTKNPTLKDTAKNLLRYILSFLVAAFLYYLVWKLFQKAFGIWTSDSYNGLSSVGDYSDTGILALLGTTYRFVFNYFAYPETFITMAFRGISLSIVWVYLIRLCNLVIFAWILIRFIRQNRKNKTGLWQTLCQIFILLILPMGVNFVCLISKGMVHSLMMYAFCLFYILAVKLADDSATYSAVDCAAASVIDSGDDSAADSVTTPKIQTNKAAKKLPVSRFILSATIILILWSNIVYANQVYLKKDLQDSAAHSLMTRILHDIEAAEGYVPGVTPVAFSGSFEDSPYVGDIEAFSAILPYGMGKTSLLYEGTEEAYLTYILNANINFAEISKEDEAVTEMPLYPTEGSIAYVDSILVIKISN